MENLRLLVRGGENQKRRAAMWRNVGNFGAGGAGANS